MEQGTKQVKKQFEGITVNGKPLEVYVDEVQTSEIEKHHKHELRSASAGVGYVSPATKFGNTSGERSQNRNYTQALSPEILAHCNYLQEIGGTKAVNEYLNKPQAQEAGER